MPNYQEIKRKLGIIADYLKRLKPYMSIETSVLMSNDEKVLAIERLFQLVVDESADINSYISYQVLNKVPESFRSSFHILADGGVLDQVLVNSMAESVKVRNQIIHDYERLQKIDTIESIKKFFPLYEKYLDILVKKFV